MKRRNFFSACAAAVAGLMVGKAGAGEVRKHTTTTVGPWPVEKKHTHRYVIHYSNGDVYRYEKTETPEWHAREWWAWRKVVAAAPLELSGVSFAISAVKVPMHDSQQIEATVNRAYASRMWCDSCERVSA